MHSFVREHLKIILFLLILGILGIIKIAYQLQEQQAPIPTKQDQELVRETNAILTRQKVVRKFYTSLSMDEQTKAMVFYELVEPLGGLDPIAKPANIPDIHATVNFLFGAYFGVFHFPTDEAGYSATAPIRHESDFDEKDFFNKNKKTLVNLAKTFGSDNNLNVINGGSGSLNDSIL